MLMGKKSEISFNDKYIITRPYITQEYDIDFIIHLVLNVYMNRIYYENYNTILFKYSIQYRNIFCNTK